MAAELAVALPVVVLTLALGAGALGAAARQVALQDAAADAARMLGRGESDDAAARIVSGAVPGAGLSSSRGDELVCATTSADAEIGGVIRLPLMARSCALDGGG
ncbi:hypothetical protein KZC51_15825 [Microbacterium sp. SSW1-49]|uniref:TadE family protein n=1 Tax=Microbacterium croceum TaxID=2851645 RepID=A0ABT0FHR3_9MICO|nr:hypothetical protein [Microbacterium croceum]